MYIGSMYLRLPLDRFFLYNANDPGYVAPGYEKGPIMGIHHFNDFLQMMSYVNQAFPYDSNQQYPNMYGPASVFLLKPLLMVPTLLGVILVSVTTILFWFAATTRFLRINSLNMQILSFMILIFMSRPFLLSLDRGNIQGLFVAGCILWFYLVNFSSRRLGGFVLVCLIAIKPYAVILILWYLSRKYYGNAFRILLASISVSIICLAFLSPQGILLEGIRGFAKGAAIQSASYTSGLSLAAWILRILDASSMIPNSEQAKLYIRVFQALCIGVVTIIAFYLLKNQSLSVVDQLFVLLSAMTIATPVSWDYNAIWLPFWILAKLHGFGNERPTVKDSRVPFGIIAGLILLIYPWPINWIGGMRVAVGPLSMMFCPVVLYIWLRFVMVLEKAQ